MARLKVTCWQCGRKRVSPHGGRSGGYAGDEFRSYLARSGWFLWRRGMRFCPRCATSAKLALGVTVDAGLADRKD